MTLVAVVLIAGLMALWPQAWRDFRAWRDGTLPMGSEPREGMIRNMSKANVVVVTALSVVFIPVLIIAAVVS